MQKMMGLLRRCVEDYDMIADGDKIVFCFTFGHLHAPSGKIDAHGRKRNKARKEQQ